MRDRVLKVIENSNLTTSDFAYRVGVQPSQVSHIKTGRNQVTLDIVTKILKAYPEISPDWLLFGNGDMYKNKVETSENQEYKAKKQPIQLEMGDLFDSIPSNSTNDSKENELTSVSENISDSSNEIETKKSETVVPTTDQNFSASSSDEKNISVESKSSTNPIEEKNQNTISDSITSQPSIQVQVETKKEESPVREIPHTYVKKIIVFYSDKTYEEFIPSN